METPDFGKPPGHRHGPNHRHTPCPRRGSCTPLPAPHDRSVHLPAAQVNLEKNIHSIIAERERAQSERERAQRERERERAQRERAQRELTKTHVKRHREIQ